ncbi:MAG TPA: hypothetical protein O0X64_03735 [Methanocorpusculum sp.]|nr:hypothetical protein [Methanocorpusculum sp.]
MGFWNRTKTTMDVAEDIDWPALVHLSWKGELLMELKSRGTKFTPEDLEERLVRYSKKLEHVKKEYAVTLLSCKCPSIQVLERAYAICLCAFPRKKRLA